jgi:RNA polymerase sigma-70 factor, ECF subfamily
MALFSSHSRNERFNRIAEQHIDAVWRVARRCGVPADLLDDVVQEVFIIVCRRLDEISRDQERAFVVGTTVRVSANLRRTLRRRLEDPLLESDDLPEKWHETQQEAHTRRRQGLELLDDALACMTDVQREVFVLTELEQLTAREVGQQLSIHEAAVVSRLRRAREIFRSFCEQRQHALESPPPPKTGAFCDA